MRKKSEPLGLAAQSGQKGAPPTGKRAQPDPRKPQPTRKRRKRRLETARICTRSREPIGLQIFSDGFEFFSDGLRRPLWPARTFWTRSRSSETRLRSSESRMRAFSGGTLPPLSSWEKRERDKERTGRGGGAPAYSLDGSSPTVMAPIVVSPSLTGTDTCTCTMRVLMS